MLLTLSPSCQSRLIEGGRKCLDAQRLSLPAKGFDNLPLYDAKSCPHLDITKYSCQNPGPAEQAL